MSILIKKLSSTKFSKDIMGALAELYIDLKKLIRIAKILLTL